MPTRCPSGRMRHGRFGTVGKRSRRSSSTRGAASLVGASGVDPVTRQDFWQLIIRLVGQDGSKGTAVLVSTPYMDEAARCTRVGFMMSGHIVQEGSPSEFRKRLEGRVLELAGEPLALLRRLVEKEQGVSGVQMFGDRLHLRVEEGQAQAVMEQLEQHIPEAAGRISRLRLVQPQLEDVFMDLLERQSWTNPTS